jgi:hypothetical protein
VGSGLQKGQGLEGAIDADIMLPLRSAVRPTSRLPDRMDIASCSSDAGLSTWFGRPGTDACTELLIAVGQPGGFYLR